MGYVLETYKESLQDVSESRASLTKSIFSNEYDEFRRLLVEARKTAGLTQDELARQLSRTQSYVSKYERGERRLDLIEFLELARVLKFDPHQFIDLLSFSCCPVDGSTGK